MASSNGHGPWLTPDAILSAVVDWTGVSKKEILGKSHLRHICQARQLYELCLRNNGMSYPAIAEVLGFKSHKSVMTGVKRASHREANRVLEVARSRR